MDLLDEVLADPALYYEFKLGPGDILTANNYNVMHARTQFVDDPNPALGRHMLRIWLTLRRNRRPLPPPFRESREFGASYRRRLATRRSELIAPEGVAVHCDRNGTPAQTNSRWISRCMAAAKRVTQGKHSRKEMPDHALPAAHAPARFFPCICTCKASVSEG